MMGQQAPPCLHPVPSLNKHMGTCVRPLIWEGQSRDDDDYHVRGFNGWHQLLRHRVSVQLKSLCSGTCLQAMKPAGAAFALGLVPGTSSEPGPRKSYVQRVLAEAEVAGSPLALLPVVLLKHNPHFKSAAVKRKALRKQTPSKHILNFISSGGPPCFSARFHGSLCIIFFSSSSNFNSCPTRGCSFRGFQP